MANNNNNKNKKIFRLPHSIPFRSTKTSRSATISKSGPSDKIKEIFFFEKIKEIEYLEKGPTYLLI